MTSKERKKQIKEERKKNLFSKICKYVFYLIAIFATYVLVKKLLQILGIIEADTVKKTYENTESNSINSDNKKIELKSSNTKSE
jgi:hypothetical protein